MSRHRPQFALRLASTPADLAAAQALRYRVFVEELGAEGASVDHARRIEADRFDAFCEHLLLVDAMRGGAAVGAYRLMTQAGAARAGGFATEEEFDIAALRRSGRRLLELGRSCLHPDYRGGTAMHLLWQGLAALVRRHEVGLLFGLASFPGADPARHVEAFSNLHHGHLAPPDLRPRSLRPAGVDLLAPERVDRRAAVLATPPLVKAYLRLGGRVGEGAFVDRRWGCTDVCLVLDPTAVPALGRRVYAGPIGAGPGD